MRWLYMLAVALLGAALVVDIWYDPNYRLAANVALIVMTVLVATFTLLYLLRSRWWVNEIGKVYLAKSVVLALVLAQGTLAVWWAADFPGRDHVRFAIYALGAVAYAPMIITLGRRQQADRKSRAEREPSP